MENLVITFIVVTVIGFGIAIFFISKLLREQKQANESLTSSNRILTDLKAQLEKIEGVGKEHKSISKEGFTQIENALKETVKLD